MVGISCVTAPGVLHPPTTPVEGRCRSGLAHRSGCIGGPRLEPSITQPSIATGGINHEGQVSLSPPCGPVGTSVAFLHPCSPTRTRVSFSGNIPATLHGDLQLNAIPAAPTPPTAALVSAPAITQSPSAGDTRFPHMNPTNHPVSLGCRQPSLTLAEGRVSFSHLLATATMLAGELPCPHYPPMPRKIASHLPPYLAIVDASGSSMSPIEHHRRLGQ
jgi:hypothetical protein